LSIPALADGAEDKALEFVKKLNGKVTHDENAPGKPVIALDLYLRQVTDEGLKRLAGLTNLTSLSLGSTQVTDAGMKELDGLSNIRTLILVFTQVTDAGLKELAALTNLTTLHLRGTRVSDVGLKELQQALPNCRIFK